MWSILIQSQIDSRETLIEELWECGTTGVIENSNTVQAFFQDDPSMLRIAERLSCPVLEVSNDIAIDNAPTLSPNRDPVYAGEHFFIVSSGMNHSVPPGRKRLVIDAVDSFGSGSHESTQLVVQALEEYPLVNTTVLDIGCGSGILAAIAQELGAAQIIACDTHIGALYSARKNSPGLSVFAGSVDALAPSCADVVIVNISARAIERLTDELLRVTKPGGLLILAGFTADRTPAEIRPERVFQLNDWLCWCCHPENLELIQAPEALQPFPTQWW